MKLLRLFALAGIFLLVGGTPVLAADSSGTGSFYGNAVGAGVGVGVAILGAGLGFGRIGGSALESMARQPDKAAEIQTAMLIVAALLEGATFFGLVVCIIMALRA